MAKRLEGTVAIVAGGAGGIGAAICERFLEEGAFVVCADFSDRRGNAFVAGLEAPAGRIEFKQLDATSTSSWSALVDDIQARFGRIDILVNAFYAARAGSVESISLPDWELTFSGTAAGVFQGMQACVPFMAAGASIINIASIAAHGGTPDNIAYSSAKAAVIAMSRSAAAKLGSRGIRVNVVTPGSVQTIALDRAIEALAADGKSSQDVLNGFVQDIPLGRVGQPREIANAVLFLASAEASYVTGAELLVDGGSRTG